MSGRTAKDNCGFVDLVDVMGSDLTIVNAARVSFGKRKEEMSAGDVKLINFLGQHEHMSPFRHAVLQFHIKMPEFCARQMYKHIIGSDYAFKDGAWNEISGRYVELTEMWVPEYLRLAPENKKQGSIDEPHPASEIFLNEMAELYNYARALYHKMIESGVAAEQARAVLPVAYFTEFYWTASLQAAMHFVRMRSTPDTQAEIREYALLMGELIKERFPHGYDALIGIA